MRSAQAKTVVTAYMLAGLIVGAVCTASPASAHRRHGGAVFFGFSAGPAYPYYAPPPVYYPRPYYGPPAYYAPPPGYYVAPPPVYVPPPVYYPPPGYYPPPWRGW